MTVVLHACQHTFISQKENLKPGVFSVPASTLARMPAELAAIARSSAALSTASVSVFFFRIGTMTTCGQWKLLWHPRVPKWLPIASGRLGRGIYKQSLS